MTLHGLTALAARDRIARGEITASDLLDSVLARIREVEDRVRAYITITEDLARAQAAAVDAARRRGEPLGPLAGVPVAVKDIICTEGVRTTCGSRKFSTACRAASCV